MRYEKTKDNKVAVAPVNAAIAAASKVSLQIEPTTVQTISASADPAPAPLAFGDTGFA